MHQLLPKIESAAELRDWSVKDLKQLCGEVREVLCNLLNSRSAHFASNLGVVELCVALHSVFDFRQDRLIWDTGHQIYPHKLITGRYHEFPTIRTRGGLMGYPNPHESDYDLFMTGHAGSSVSTVLGLQSGDELSDEDRQAVAVIGDGAFPSGIVYEALNNAGGLKSNVLVILNDNKMSICPRVGGMASYLDRLRTNSFYTGLKTEIGRVLNKVPLLGDPVERFLGQMKEAFKAGLHGGMFFEDIGFRYLGPIDGHNVTVLRKYMKMIRKLKGPILLHVVTEKGHGFEPAEEDPVYFHSPPAFKQESGKVVPAGGGGSKAFTNYARDAILKRMEESEKVTALTAAMCQGNKLEPVREKFPRRFFDTGICESHAVAFAAGQAKAGVRPVVAIYSTFLQRSFDQIFQEVALQDLPVTFMLDRAGLAGPDGPTHHGVFDMGYMRLFPNMVVMAPGSANEIDSMLMFSMSQEHPVSIRYPKATASERENVAPLELGKAEVIHWGADGTIMCCGALLPNCIKAQQQLLKSGIDVGVVNARFVKPIDKEVIRKALEETGFLVTVEEAALAGGFGSALLEAAGEMSLDASRVHRLGIPDEFIEHGDRNELLASLELNADGIAATCLNLAQRNQADVAIHRVS